jgi:hypothetical protein
VQIENLRYPQCGEGFAPNFQPVRAAP